MDSSSTSSSRARRVPRALLLAAAAVLAAEAVLAAAVPANMGRHEVDEMLYRIDVRPVTREAVLLGDSVTLHALDGTPALSRVEDLSTNMAVGVPGSVCLLLRILDSPAPVRVVFLDFIPETYEYDMDTGRAMTYFESCFLRTDELLLLKDARGITRQFLRAVRNKFLWPPSYKRRGWAMGALPALAALQPPEAPQDLRWTPRTRDNAIAERQRRSWFHPSPMTDRYLRELLRRTRDRGIRVVVVSAPLQTETRAAWAANGRLRDYGEFLDSLRKDWPHVEVVPAETFARFPTEQFGDHVHLRPPHRIRYGRELSDLLSGVLEEKGR